MANIAALDPLQSFTGPDWAQAARREAWEVFSATRWPLRTDKGWRQTDVTGIQFDEMVATGSLIGKAQPIAPQENGVIVADLRTALETHPDLVRDHLVRFPQDRVDLKFTSLARALWTDGIFVYVPKDVEVVVPHLLAEFGTTRLFCPRLLVVVEAGAKLTIFDEHASSDFDESRMSCGIVDLFVGDGAEVKYIHLNGWGKNVFNFHHMRAEIGQDAKFISLTLGLGSSLTKATIEAVLAGRGAQSDLFGLVFGSGEQVFDHHTVQHHAAGQTPSNILYKVALTDKARSTYSGMIRIEHGAQQSNAYQSNKNILLSHESHADTIPNLEILANDVRCTHGATVAPVDETQIFYMQTRGIQEEEAKRMIVEGFLEQVVDEAALGDLDELIRGKVSNRIVKRYQ